jgi:hypothetical protein
MGGGKERKMSGELATASQVRDGGKEMKQYVLQIDITIKNILLQNLST